jgi:hypothetical protein
LDELSLVKMWEAVSIAIGVQNGSQELESFRLYTNRDDKIDSLSFVFHGNNAGGRPEVYFVSKNSRGEIGWYSNESKFVSPTLKPTRVFTEIDSLGLSSLELGDAGLLMQVDFKSGDVGYNNKYGNIYRIEGGKLRQLKEIVFHSRYPWCTISVYKLFPNETVITDDGQTTAQTTTVRIPVPPEERTSQTWFLSEDINKAETVEYLENK